MLQILVGVDTIGFGGLQSTKKTMLGKLNRFMIEFEEQLAPHV